MLPPRYQTPTAHVRANKNGSLVRDEAAVALRGTTHMKRAPPQQAHAPLLRPAIGGPPWLPTHPFGLQPPAREATSGGSSRSGPSVAGPCALDAFAAYS